MRRSATRRFFKSIEGSWTGPGEIIAGKYKGTKFNCTFDGTTPDKKAGMTLDGGCRVGVFTQKMTASIEQKAGRYQGKFLDGAEGKGMDVISGSVVDGGQKVVLAINRQQLNGVMQARIADANTMNVTISVRVEKQLVPVIGMSLKRVDFDRHRIDCSKLRHGHHLGRTNPQESKRRLHSATAFCHFCAVISP